MKRYLAEDGVALPPRAPSRAGSQPQKIAALTGLVEAWLHKDITPWADVIHERLIAEHGFTGHFQRVKTHVAPVRPRIADELDAEGWGAASRVDPPLRDRPGCVDAGRLGR